MVHGVGSNVLGVKKTLDARLNALQMVLSLEMGKFEERTRSDVIRYASEKSKVAIDILTRVLEDSKVGAPSELVTWILGIYANRRHHAKIRLGRISVPGEKVIFCLFSEVCPTRHSQSIAKIISDFPRVISRVHERPKAAEKMIRTNHRISKIPSYN